MFVDNLKRNEDVSVAEKVEMIICLFCTLKDSSTVTPVLLDDMKNCKGYQFLVDFVLR